MGSLDQPGRPCRKASAKGPAHPLRRRRRLAHVLAESTGKITGPGVHRSYLRAVKRAHHNSYRVRDPATTAPTTPGRPRSTSADYHFEQQLKLRGIGLTVPLANPNRWPTIAGEWPSINAKVGLVAGQSVLGEVALQSRLPACPTHLRRPSSVVVVALLRPEKVGVLITLWACAARDDDLDPLG